MKRGLGALGIALAIHAAGPLVETLAFQLPIGTHAFELIFAIVFLAADVALLVGAALVARAEPSLRPHARGIVLLAMWTIASDLMALAPSGAADARSIAYVFAATEPFVALGVTFATLMLLAKVGRPKPSVVQAALALAAAALVLRFARATMPGSIALAWLGLVVDLARWASLVALSFLALRSSAADASASEAKPSPYRMGEAPPASAPKPPRPPIAEERADELRRAAKGLARYRTAFVARYAIAIGLMVLAIPLVGLGGIGGGALLFLFLFAAVLATTIVMLMGLSAFLRATKAIGAHGWVVTALVGLALPLVVDLFAVVAAVAVGAEAILVLGFGAAFLLGTLSLVSVARALELMGVSVEAPPIVQRARTVETLVVLQATAMTAAIVGMMSTTPARHATYSEAGVVVAALAGLAVFVCFVVVLVQHQRLVGDAYDAIVVEVGPAP